MASEVQKATKKKRSTAQGKFHTIYNTFGKRSTLATVEFDVVNTILQDLERAYSDLQDRNACYIETLDEESNDDMKIIDELNSRMEEMYDELCTARGFVATKKKSIVKNEPVARLMSNPDSRDIKLNIKKLEAPHFTGNIRDYPTFKRDYEAHMIPTFGKDAFALRSCLRGKALESVKGLGDDFDEMIGRLDGRYGCPGKIVDAILKDINKLKRVSDGDNHMFLQVIEVVERAWLDLKGMKLEAEMNTSIMMSQVEKLLPPLQKREWALVHQKIVTDKKRCIFKDLLAFLQMERQAIEYLSEETRSDTACSRKVNTVDVEYEYNSVREGGKVERTELSEVKELIEGLAQAVKGISSNYNNTYDRWNKSSKSCWYHDNNSHTIYDCLEFNSLDPKERIEAAKKHFVCFVCLKSGHIGRNCNIRNMCPVVNGRNEKCGRKHHEKLHLYNVQGMNNNGCLAGTRDTALLMISEVFSGKAGLSVLWDPGANISLITHSSAQRIGLSGRDITLKLTKVGNHSETLNTKEYVLPLNDENGKLWKIPVYGMDEITCNQPYVDMEKVKGWFKVEHSKLMSRPGGDVDVLIGTDWCKLLPNKVDEQGGLQLMRNQFGYCIRGYHPQLDIHHKSSNTFQIHMVAHGISYDREGLYVLSCCQIGESIQKFLDIENMGTQFSPKCGACKCGTCILGNSNCTIKEEYELRMIESGLKLDIAKKEWTVEYPWTKSPDHLPNNYPSIFARMKSTERRIIKKGIQYCEMYNEQILDMIKRGVARKLAPKEVRNYSGPVHYMSHHEVLKTESLSTPMRLVFAANAIYMGHCLNDYWAKGPNVLNDLLGILLRFRQYSVALVADIKKMYNTIKLSVLDQHTHRFLWRWLNVEADPIHYVLLTVTFGDKPSGVIAAVALRKTVELLREKYPLAWEIVNHNMYVDDLLKSVETVSEAKQVISQVEDSFVSGGFKIKHWMASGNFQNSRQREEMKEVKFADASMEKVLGMYWSPTNDRFVFKVCINFDVNRHNGYKKDNVTLQTFDENVPSVLTPRLMISQLSKVFDPLGLVSPYILAGKLLMRRTVEHMVVNVKNKWDMPITDDLKEEWLSFFRNMFELESLYFHRCVKPDTAVSEPELIIFTDASELAYGSCAYVRWEVEGNYFYSQILMAKNRIAPKRTLSIPRLELCAAVLGSRLRKQILNEMDYNFSRVIFLTDSMIVRSQIQKESYGFKTFTATRIGEIQQNSEPSEWMWISTDMNPADLTSRATEVDRLSSLLWMAGPPFLRQPIEEWPVKTDCSINVQDLPDKIVVNMITCEDMSSAAIQKLDIIEIDRFNSYKLLINVSSIILSIVRIQSFKVGGILSDGECFRVAELEWIKHVQLKLGSDWEKVFRRLGPWRNREGIIVVGERLAEWFKLPWNQDELILLPAKGRFTYLYVLMIHNEDHTINTAVAKVRHKFWVPQLMKLMRNIKSKCVECRKLDKKTIEQKMGGLPLFRLTPSPPFYITFVDLFGPIQIKDTVKGRCRGKAYGVIFSCGSCRGVYLDVGDGYDTDSFLLVLRRFITIHGYPSKFISDNGSQIVAGAKEMMDIMIKWDWSRIARFGKENVSTWEFNKSAEAPWQNGCSESLIRLTKRNLASVIGSNVLSFSELQTVLFEVSSLLNERPIGMNPGDPAENYICPNDLMLGRASSKVPQGNFDVNATILKRLYIVEQIVHCYWKNWQEKYFHTLMIRQQWHTKVRDLKKGDIVIVKSISHVRGKWQMAVVEEATPGKDGHVRDVILKYKNLKQGSVYSGNAEILIKRSVHNLILILPVEEQIL